MNTNEVQAELKFQKALDDSLGRLVEIGEKLIDELGDKIKRIEAAQIRNVIAVANSAPHPAIVTNFVRYQMGRGGNPGKAWRDTGLGDKVITRIDIDLKSIASEIAKGSPDFDAESIRVRLASLMLGFMNRHYVYKSKVSREGM